MNRLTRICLAVAIAATGGIGLTAPAQAQLANTNGIPQSFRTGLDPGYPVGWVGSKYPAPIRTGPSMNDAETKIVGHLAPGTGFNISCKLYVASPGPDRVWYRLLGAAPRWVPATYVARVDKEPRSCPTRNMQWAPALPR